VHKTPFHYSILIEEPLAILTSINQGSQFIDELKHIYCREATTKLIHFLNSKDIVHTSRQGQGSRIYITLTSKGKTLLNTLQDIKRILDDKTY
jgi:DNA-binding PadR family transcriptional regulator